MANPQQQSVSRIRLFLLAGGGLLALGLILSGVFYADGLRRTFSDADRAESTAAVARMDAAQARADQTREQAQTRVYKGY